MGDVRIPDEARAAAERANPGLSREDVASVLHAAAPLIHCAGYRQGQVDELREMAARLRENGHQSAAETLEDRLARVTALDTVDTDPARESAVSGAEYEDLTPVTEEPDTYQDGYYQALADSHANGPTDTDPRDRGPAYREGYAKARERLAELRQREAQG